MVSPGAEITVEVAPGTLSDEILAGLLRAGVNRVSLGVQSFIDQESRAVGRLHTRAVALDDIRRLREAGIGEISIDLIAGLPHQTGESWERSLDEIVALEVPHASVYMLEVDADSRLGRELIAGGSRYHAHHVPDEALTVALYERATERLNAAGIAQYEISNFARAGHQSQHNLRYWQRLPYYGFGVDAHSMLLAPTRSEPHRAIRLATPDSLDDHCSAGAPILERTVVSEQQAIEETYFLGLRMNCGVELLAIKEEFGIGAVEDYRESHRRPGVARAAGDRRRVAAADRARTAVVQRGFRGVSARLRRLLKSICAGPCIRRGASTARAKTQARFAQHDTHWNVRPSRQREL